MDEITMYTALRPQAPGNAGETSGPGSALGFASVTQRYPRITANC